MIVIPTHASPTDFPLTLDVATAIIALGVLVFTVVAYDMYHYYHL